MLSAVMAAAAVTGCSSSKKETEAQTKAQTEAQTEAKTEAAAPETEAAAEEAATEAAAAAEEAATEAVAAAEEAATEAVAAAEEAATETAAAAEEAATEAEAIVEEAVSEAAAVAEEAVAEEAATEAAVVEEAISEAAAVVEEAVAEEAAAEAATEAEALVEEAVSEEAAAEAATEAEALVEEAVSEAAAVAEEAAAEAAEAATEAEALVEEAVSEAAAIAEAVVEEAVSEAAAAAEEATTEAAAAAEEAATEAEASMQEAVDAAAAAATAATAAFAETEEEAQTEAVEEEAAQTEAFEEETAVEEETEEAVETALEEPALTEEEETEELTEEETEEAEEISYSLTLAGESVTGTYEDMQVADTDIVVLYMNDVHGGISADKDYSGSDTSLGYAGLAAVKAEAEEDAAAVTTVDNGDAIQGSVVTTESDGQDAMTLMDMIGYDIRIPGNHEFDYGMDAFLEYAKNADSEFICSNFIDTTTGEPIFDGYTLVDYAVNDDVLTIGYVGMCTPETIAKSTPTYFQDEDGNYIYGFSADTPQDLYDNIQASIDAAYEDGADFVIGLSHMGDTGVEADWSSIAVAANTTGMDIILDGHAHSVIPGEIVTNKDGEDVLITSTGTKLDNIGVLKLSVAQDGEVTAVSGLVNELSEEELASDAYAQVAETVQEIEDQYAYLFVEEGNTDFDMVIYDPETEERIIRKQETNLGDFLADAYRIMFNNDIGMINGGSIRANVDAGDINYMEIITVFPWNTEYSVVEVTGQTVLDALEMGAHLYPEECGGFLQVSGLTYKIDTTIPSSVNVNSDGEFVSVDGEYRVKDVMVGEEPLDLERTYRLGINTYYSKEYGDGMTMFKDCEFVFPTEEAAEAVEESTEAEGAAAEEIPAEPVIDHDVIIAYLESLGKNVPENYADPYGEGRIVLITEETKLEEAAAAVASEAEDLTAAVAAAAEAVGEAVAEEATEAEQALEEIKAEVEVAVEEQISEAEVIVEALIEEMTETETE